MLVLRINNPRDGLSRLSIGLNAQSFSQSLSCSRDCWLLTGEYMSGTDGDELIESLVRTATAPSQRSLERQRRMATGGERRSRKLPSRRLSFFLQLILFCCISSVRQSSVRPSVRTTEQPAKGKLAAERNAVSISMLTDLE